MRGTEGYVSFNLYNMSRFERSDVEVRAFNKNKFEGAEVNPAQKCFLRVSLVEEYVEPGTRTFSTN